MLRDICRLKGQEENVLQGQGLVVGLKGSGDGSLKPTMRALARSLQLMGGQIATDLQGRLVEKDIEQTKNVALVFVTATVPASGAQPGDKLPCTISAVNAKSLEGGMLLMTPLVGPRADRPTVYALAQGPITIDNPRIPTTGYITAGCKMEAEVRTEFIDQGKITLILENSQSSFGMAQDIEDLINQFTSSGFDGNGTRSNQPGSNSTASASSSSREKAASAMDQLHIEVKIPTIYQDHPVQFISELLKLRLVVGKNNRRVVIREREGVVAIGEDVMIAPVAISHKNLTISSKSSSGGANGFIPVGYDRTSAGSESTSLKQLVSALNLLAVPNEDIIAIIKTIERQGNLFGELVVE
jgi:flagellar P-ring protein precursor FlgI